MCKSIDLKHLVSDGQLFLDHEADGHVMAYLPTKFPSNHAANLIELQNGDLLCTWFAGLAEGSPDIKIVCARLPKDGDRWTEPVLLSDDYDRSEQNPALFQQADGTVWLLHTAQSSRGMMTPAEWKEKVKRGEASGHFTMQETAFVRVRKSTDNGHTWSEPVTMFDKPGSFCRHPITVLSNGDWLFPMWYSLEEPDASKPQYGRDYSVVQISSDQGETWTEVEVPESQKRVHMCIVETKPGHCVAFFRSRSADRIYRSVSEDYGRTWTVPTATSLPNNNASIQAIRLQDGAIAIIFNHARAGDDPSAVIWHPVRVPVTIALTYDEGLTFPHMRHLEMGDGFAGENYIKKNTQHHYPTIIQGRDGALHVAYTYHSRIGIKYHRIDENWITG